ncbi:MAG: HEAT repeat domain-containing protein [Candidatus Kariarchaeaceae archaeon]|jgi:HEAT repeat protein
MSKNDGVIEDEVNKLRHGTAEARKAAAMRLGRMRDPKSIPALIDAMKNDEYALTRVFAIQSLVWIADRSVIRHLIDVALTDASNLVRKTAIEALASFKDTIALKPLYRIVNTDKNNEIVRSASISIQVILGITPETSHDLSRSI